MAENETKKKPTTKKTTSTRKKKVEEKPNAETVNLNNATDIKVKNEDVKDTGFFEANSIGIVSVDNVDQKINSIKETVGNNMKSVISVVNANANNSIITTKAELAKTNTLIKEKSESINNNLIKIEELLKNNDGQKINPDDIKTALDHFRDNIESLYSSVHEFIDEDEKIFESIDEKYNALYKNISLITDAIVNDDEKSVEDLLVAQNQYIKDLMEKNNERINLNSERMNMIIGNMSALSESIKNNHSELMSYIPEYLEVTRTEASNIMGQIDDLKRHSDNCFSVLSDEIRDDIKKSIEKHDNIISSLVKTNIIATIIVVFIIILGFAI